MNDWHYDRRMPLDDRLYIFQPELLYDYENPQNLPFGIQKDGNILNSQSKNGKSSTWNQLSQTLSHGNQTEKETKLKRKMLKAA